MDSHLDAIAMSGEVFVNGIIQHLENAMVQPPFIRITDVHPWPFAYRLQTLQFIYLGGIVFLPRIGLGTANWDNGSIDGLVSRIAELAPNLFGNATQTLAKVIIAAAAMAVIGVTLWFARHGAHETWTLRLGVSALITALLIVSSVTWQHHLVTLLLPLATGIAWITVRRPGARYSWWLFTAYAMCWTDRRAFPLPLDLQVHSWADAALVLAGTSVKLVGLLLMWTLLLQMLRVEARRASVRRLDQSAAGAAVQPAA